MKTMTCKQLGGACNQPFTANTFDEISALSKKHGMEMFQKGDTPHLEAMNEMQKANDLTRLYESVDGRQEKRI
jgi:hypothetical protein